MSSLKWKVFYFWWKAAHGGTGIPEDRGGKHLPVWEKPIVENQIWMIEKINEPAYLNFPTSPLSQSCYWRGSTRAKSIFLCISETLILLLVYFQFKLNKGIYQVNEEWQSATENVWLTVRGVGRCNFKCLGSPIGQQGKKEQRKSWVIWALISVVCLFPMWPLDLQQWLVRVMISKVLL